MHQSRHDGHLLAVSRSSYLREKTGWKFVWSHSAVTSHSPDSPLQGQPPVEVDPLLVTETTDSNWVPVIREPTTDVEVTFEPFTSVSLVDYGWVATRPFFGLAAYAAAAVEFVQPAIDVLPASVAAIVLTILVLAGAIGTALRLGWFQEMLMLVSQDGRAELRKRGREGREG